MLIKRDRGKFCCKIREITSESQRQHQPVNSDSAGYQSFLVWHW